ncbi:MAG: hypothetical protein E7218_08990 [Anaerofustis stercorihominis]|nr:hypothetical protein [Anaerofustis stercorihominis]
MKKILYVRLRESIKQQNTGIFRKAADKFLGRTNNERSYECMDIYDERLVKTGVLFTYSGDTEDIYEAINTVFTENGCEKIAFEDYTVREITGIDGIDGTKEILECQLKKYFAENKINSYSFAGIILSERTDPELTKIITDSFRYIILYSDDRKNAEQAGDRMMEYNASSAVVTDRIKSLSMCDTIIDLAGTKEELFKNTGKIYLCPYIKFPQQDESMLFYGYSDKFAPVVLSAAYKQAFCAE